MSVLRTISEIGLAANGIGMTHDTVRKMHQLYVQPIVDRMHNAPVVKLTVNCPRTVRVNEPVTLSGTGVGMIRILSGDVFERDAFVEDGKWATRLFFSKPGKYDMHFIDTLGQEADCTVTAIQ